MSQIQVDIKRTSSPKTGKLFQPSEAESLVNILKALAFVFPQIGYCQGMNYVAAALYSYFSTQDEGSSDLNAEDNTFLLFVSLMVHKRLKPLFTSQVPDYHLRNYILKELLNQFLPQLMSHFKKLNLNLEMLTGNWLMTLFTGYLPYDLLMPILDNFFLEGWSAIYRVSIALLELLAPKFLEHNDMGMIAQTINNLRQENFAGVSVNKLLVRAYKIDFSTKELPEDDRL